MLVQTYAFHPVLQISLFACSKVTHFAGKALLRSELSRVRNQLTSLAICIDILRHLVFQ